MVLDTSAVVAILKAEPQRDRLLKAITQAQRRLMSAASVLEAAMVLEGRCGNAAGADLELFLLAKATGEPVLCVGNDFPQTDIACIVLS